MSVAKKIAETAKSSSWIRQMFEEGARMQQLHGRDKVVDLSIGNPNLDPPQEFQDAILELVQDTSPGVHGYMTNAGYPETCAAVASYLSEEHGVEVKGHHVVMTSGAAGALNVIFKAILDPGEEVIVPRPYFVDYGSYVDNHQGVLKPFTTAPDFNLDLDAVAGALGPRSRAILINSPNNPTGRVYPEETIDGLGALLRERSRELGRTIYLVSDEPYRRIVYDGVQVPSVMSAYENSIVATSYSKELSLAGERIGYLAVNPHTENADELMAGLVLANRILGFINAPALMQRVVTRVQGVTVDVSPYKRNRDVLCECLRESGFTVNDAEGAFYLFPRSPLEDDVAFCRELQEHLVLTVPGTGFGTPGYFRLAYCVDAEVVDRALPALRSVGAKYYG